MFFRRDNEHERRIWVDRDLDARVDNASICEPCDGLLHAIDPKGENWHEMESRLCPDCRTEFQAHALAVDLLALPRPFNGDIEGRYITNEEFAEEARPGLREALSYFMPDPADRFVPGRGDAFAPGPSDGFLPGRGDAFGPGPGDGFLPGRGDAFGPGLGDRFLPGRGDAFMPGPGDGFLPSPEDRLLTRPGDYFLPGMEDYLLPE